MLLVVSLTRLIIASAHEVKKKWNLLDRHA